MKKYYIKATGSTCYDNTGVTFPHNESFQLQEEDMSAEKFVDELWGRNIRWENQFGWENQPQVLTFEASEEDATAIGYDLPHGLIVVECTW